MIPNQLTLDAIRDFARNVEERLNAMEARNVDFNQRRITNAGNSISSFDYVTRFELDNLKSSLTKATQTSTTVPSGVLSTKGVTMSGASTDNGIVRFDGTTGSKIQNTSGPILEDDGTIANLVDPIDAQDAATKAYVDAHGGSSRGTVAATTASLADQATESSSLALGKSSLVYKIVVDQFARVRLYSTSAGRDADVSRAPTTTPSSNADLLLDVVQNSSGTTTFRMMPPAIAQNMDGSVVSTIYYNITNLSGSTHTITATFTRLLLET